MTQVIHTSGVSPSDTATENIIKINAVGTVNMGEAFYPVLTEGGVIEAYTMTPETAVVKLMWILARERNVEAVRRRFYEPVAHDLLTLKNPEIG